MSENIINLKELKDYLYGWYYENFGRGDLDTLTKDEAIILCDCMRVIHWLEVNNPDVKIKTRGLV